MHESSDSPDDESLDSQDIAEKNDKNQPLPPIKTNMSKSLVDGKEDSNYSTDPKKKSHQLMTIIDMEKDETNEITNLKKMSHHEILKWLDQKNLGNS